MLAIIWSFGWIWTILIALPGPLPPRPKGEKRVIILLYAAIVLAAITVVGNLMLHKWNATRLEKQMAERVEGYLGSMQREGMPEQLEVMADEERRHLLLTSARQIRAESDRRFYIATIGGIVAFFVALGFAIEGAGTRDFVIALAIGAAALYGLNVFLHRSLRARLAERGIDMDRLRTD